MAKHLVVANRTVGSEALFARALQILETDRDATFVILVPARPVPVRFEPLAVGEWPVATGTRRARRLARRLLGRGARRIDVRAGASDPAEAIEEMLSAEHFDDLLISTLAPPLSSWLQLDLLRRVALRHPELPVHHLIVRGSPQPAPPGSSNGTGGAWWRSRFDADGSHRDGPGE